MDRFFSKLDLRDIKIKPEGNRFLPTEDDTVEEEIESEATSIEPLLAPELFTESETLEAPPQEPVHLYASAQVAESPLSNSHANGAAHEYIAADEVEEVAYDNGEVLKVSARSRPSAVAGAIAGVVRDAGRAEVQAIGAGATNQAVKAVAIARDYLRESGIDAVCIPAFIDVTIDNEERTAIRLVVEAR
ncbi:hypothetical protein BH23CHL5_BH23CHL5_20530 [soil metagenome]